MLNCWHVRWVCWLYKNWDVIFEINRPFSSWKMGTKTKVLRIGWERLTSSWGERLQATLSPHDLFQCRGSTQIDYWMLRRRNLRLVLAAKVIPSGNIAALHIGCSSLMSSSACRSNYMYKRKSMIRWWKLSEHKKKQPSGNSPRCPQHRFWSTSGDFLECNHHPNP